MVTSSGAGFSTASVRENVFQKASEYCESKGLVMMPVSFNAEPGRMGRNAPSADLVFRALKPGDPELGRPNLRESDEKLDISHDINIKTDQPAVKKADLYEELIRLNELKEKGILTEEEFQIQKEKLLSN
ncbi:SHOCT domain-containing protein [Puniceicoccales bacterium CK1056]|uniref:SHOCT domain-containing protein n=2 Tax=Oceanipulchritudo coccoides TaxID=2706888 RepID=A0A6B2M4X2_9BACT|nr:SHOCT domain-containing protein [Oceanipulchritudo coccoides]